MTAPRNDNRVIWRFGIAVYLIGLTLGVVLGVLGVPLWVCLLMALACAEAINWHMRRRGWFRDWER